jgi:lysophospholipase L1-like esterase
MQQIRSLTVAQDARGGTWAVWEADNGTDVELVFSYWDGAEWSAPQPVRSRPDAWDRAPSLAVTADGQVWLAWFSAERDTPWLDSILVSRWTGRDWTEPEEIPQGGITKAKAPALAASPDGTMWLAWVGFDGTDDEIFASHRDGSNWLPPQQVSADDGESSLYDRQPQLAVGPDGKPWVVWTGHQSGPDDEIYASHWTGTEWAEEQMISHNDDALDGSPSLALDAQGQPWVAWEGRATGIDHFHVQILTSKWEEDSSTWTDEEAVSPAVTTNLFESFPSLSLSKQGELHLSWVATGATGSALAHAQWQDGTWTEPRLVATDVPDDAVVLTFAPDSTPETLQLGFAPESRAPLRRFPVDDDAEPLSGWIDQQMVEYQILVDPYWGLFHAHGDSITWGQYGGLYPYPARLEDQLTTKVDPSFSVNNAGLAGETTKQGFYRIKDEVPAIRPEFIIYLEGTNDVSHQKTPAHVYGWIEFTIAVAKDSGVDHVKFMVGTLIPRKDNFNDETEEMNLLAVIPATESRSAALCDQWQAFYDYGPWEQIYWDEKHPDETGLQLLADTFYGCLLENFPKLVEDVTPPTTWIEEPNGGMSECGQVAVAWNGVDDVSYVVDYDLQSQTNGGAWTDWLLATTALNDTYAGGLVGDLLKFRVRGRDFLGNQNDYVESALETTIQDTRAPYEVHVDPLPEAQRPPFPVCWGGSDQCSEVTAFDVQYRVGEAGEWQEWLSKTPDACASFDPDAPQYGQTYYFQARPYDQFGNVDLNLWSEPVSTKLAQFVLEGDVSTVRGEPVVLPIVSLEPAPLGVESRAGKFSVYVADGGDHELSVSRDGFGDLPPMHLSVASDLDGLGFVLPPLDDAVVNGGFENGWESWDTGGSLTPTLDGPPHTGMGAVLMGDVGELSWISQPLSITDPVDDATLSFMVRLDDDAGGSSSIHIELAGTPISYTQVVSAGNWSHVWLPVDVTAGQAITATFTLSDTPAIHLDEVSLGSAQKGGSWAFMPIISRADGP